MGFEKVYVTEKGFQLEAKSRAGKPINLLRVEIGTGQLENDQITKLTGLINKVLDCQLNSLQEIDGQTIVNFILEQKNIENSFYFREFGLIAEDPDTKEEVLYMYANAGNKAELVNDKTSTAVNDRIIDIVVKSDNSDNITITINNTGVYVDREEYQKRIQELEKAINANIPRRKSITLFAAGWTLNEATQKYEYRIDDITITEDDDIDVRIEDEEQEEALADAETRLYTYNGYYVFFAKELLEVDIEAEIIITRTKLDAGEANNNAS